MDGQARDICRKDAKSSYEEAKEDAKLQRTREAIKGIIELRKHTKPVTVEEIIAWKNEGRK